MVCDTMFLRVQYITPCPNKNSTPPGRICRQHPHGINVTDSLGGTLRDDEKHKRRVPQKFCPSCEEDIGDDECQPPLERLRRAVKRCQAEKAKKRAEIEDDVKDLGRSDVLKDAVDSIVQVLTGKEDFIVVDTPTAADSTMRSTTISGPAFKKN